MANILKGAAATADEKKSLGLFHVSDDYDRYEVARNNSFVMYIANPSDKVLKSADKDATIPAGVWEEGLRLSISKFTPPHFSINPTKIQRGNSSVKAADVPEWVDCPVEFVDYIGMNTKGILEAWHNAAYSQEDDTIAYMSDYKFDIVVTEFDAKHKVVRSWDMFGCWISSVSESPFDVESNGQRTISATLVYDRAKEHDGDSSAFPKSK